MAVRPLAGVGPTGWQAPFVERERMASTLPGEVNVQVQAGVLAGGSCRSAERVVVAGVRAQHLGVLVKPPGRTFQLGAQRLDLRGQPGLGRALGPQQLVGKRGQAGGLPRSPG